MSPRPKFTREQVQAAALALVDEHGLAELSMRNLAGALGTGPMTMYNYVRDRDELDALVVDAVMAEVRWPAAAGTWQEEVRAIVDANWRAVRNHPNVIPLILTRRSLHEATLHSSEALLRALARSGRSGVALLVAFRTVSGFVMGLAQAQLATTHPTVARMRALPPDRFPRLIEIAQATTQAGPDREFHAALDIVMAGLAAKQSRRRGAGASVRARKR